MLVVDSLFRSHVDRPSRLDRIDTCSTSVLTFIAGCCPRSSRGAYMGPLDRTPISRDPHIHIDLHLHMHFPPQNVRCGYGWATRWLFTCH